MATVRETAIELLRSHGITTIFGNPGSTELPMLGDFPDDFRYVLALQEAVAVAMADGFAQASGGVAHVNLHTAPGVGNAMGALFTAQANKAPLLITAGQQTRDQITMQALLTHRDPTLAVAPYVKWAFEPPRAQDVPAALARAIHSATLPPAGPAFVSIPMDDWAAEADPVMTPPVVGRAVDGRAGADPERVAALAAKLERARNPLLVIGGGVDAAGAWHVTVALAERQRVAVMSPPTGDGARIGFPESHPLYRGGLPAAIGPLGQALAGHDLVIVVGSSVFAYYPHIIGPPLLDGCELVQITNDPDEAARAIMGDAIVADVALTLAALLAAVGESDRTAPEPLPAPGPVEPASPLAHGTVIDTLRAVAPEDVICVVESPSATLSLRNRMRLSHPGSYYFSAGGGLGFGLPAAIGVALARPQRRVVAVLGEGSAQYAITGLWTAAAYGVPVTFLVLHNAEYAILKWFAGLEQVAGAPGLDLPALDVAAVSNAYGVPAQRVDDRDALHAALTDVLAADGPRLIEVGVVAGMATS